MSNQEFIKIVSAVAVKDWLERKIMLPSVVIAQAILESGWGTSELALNANALFGIKKNDWTGKTYFKPATEQREDGSYYVVYDTEWRAYDSWYESIIDHNNYIATRELSAGLLRYEPIIANADYRDVCELLHTCGYATSITYPEKLIQLIAEYNLTQYDVVTEEKMGKKVFIGVGHGGTDSGAVKYIVEKDANLVTALACREVLEAAGVSVMMSRYKDENDSLTEEIKECNAFDPDLAIDIHNNAGGGDGFEAFVSIVGGLGTELGKNIEAEVIKLGQNSRGVKTRKNIVGKDYYGFIRSTNCPACIVEGVFVDNATDVKAADTVAEQREFGKAYARGILKTLGISEPVTESESQTLYKVQCGAFKNKSNAEALRNRLKADGYEAVIVNG